jgi:hypothetical protein
MVTKILKKKANIEDGGSRFPQNIDKNMKIHIISEDTLFSVFTAERTSVA